MKGKIGVGGGIGGPGEGERGLDGCSTTEADEDLPVTPNGQYKRVRDLPVTPNGQYKRVRDLPISPKGQYKRVRDLPVTPNGPQWAVQES